MLMLKCVTIHTVLSLLLRDSSIVFKRRSFGSVCPSLLSFFLLRRLLLAIGALVGEKLLLLTGGAFVILVFR